MADIERLKDIATDMISNPDTYRDGVEIARAAYELQRIRDYIRATLNRARQDGGFSPIYPKGGSPSYTLVPDPDDD